MTTIVYRDGVLAGDTRVTVGEHIVSDRQRKVWRLSDGFLLGAAGKVEDVERLRRAAAKGTSIDAQLDVTALLVSPEGWVMLFEGATWVRQKKAKYFAIGSGHAIALAAMDAGEMIGCVVDAVTAVRVAIKRDTASGGRCVSVRLIPDKE